jgi:hypothetical protein
LLAVFRFKVGIAAVLVGCSLLGLLYGFVVGIA